MMEKLEPLSAQEKRVLELAGLEPPSGAEQRVLASLRASIAAGGLPPGDLTSGAASSKALVSIGGAMLLAGVGIGVLLGRTVLAPEPPPPTVIERLVRIEVPVPAAPLPVQQSAPLPAPSSPPRKAPPTAHVEPKPEPEMADELLGRERELIDAARSALLHGDAPAAIARLQSHEEAFPTGRLDEERESLWVQALVMKGELDTATAKAMQFHRKFPRSLLGPTVDAALVAPP